VKNGEFNKAWLWMFYELLSVLLQMCLWIVPSGNGLCRVIVWDALNFIFGGFVLA
jgi:hypothetical protein